MTESIFINPSITVVSSISSKDAYSCYEQPLSKKEIDKLEEERIAAKKLNIYLVKASDAEAKKLLNFLVIENDVEKERKIFLKQLSNSNTCKEKALEDVEAMLVTAIKVVEKELSVEKDLSSYLNNSNNTLEPPIRRPSNDDDTDVNGNKSRQKKYKTPSSPPRAPVRKRSLDILQLEETDYHEPSDQISKAIKSSSKRIIKDLLKRKFDEIKNAATVDLANYEQLEINIDCFVLSTVNFAQKCSKIISKIKPARNIDDVDIVNPGTPFNEDLTNSERQRGKVSDSKKPAGKGLTDRPTSPFRRKKPFPHPSTNNISGEGTKYLQNQARVAKPSPDDIYDESSVCVTRHSSDNGIEVQSTESLIPSTDFLEPIITILSKKEEGAVTDLGNTDLDINAKPSPLPQNDSTQPDGHLNALLQKVTKALKSFKKSATSCTKSAGSNLRRSFNKMPNGSGHSNQHSFTQEASSELAICSPSTSNRQVKQANATSPNTTISITNGVVSNRWNKKQATDALSMEEGGWVGLCCSQNSAHAIEHNAYDGRSA